MFSQSFNFLKMDISYDHFSETFVKYELKTTIITDRLDHIKYRLAKLFLKTVYKIIQGGTKLL